MGALGVPVFYVFGGRDEYGHALDTVQKYYPATFGTEDVQPVWEKWMVRGLWEGQIVNNMVDIWTGYYAFWDWDMRPQEDQEIYPPIVPDRLRGSDPAVPLNPLPEPLYGLQAVTVETNGNMVPPVWPEGPFHYIFILGGINDGGAVVPTMRWFDAAALPDQRQEQGETGPGDYSPVVDMPVERAYHKAFVIPPRGGGDPKWQIVVLGGFDRNGNYVAQVDRFTFTNTKSPTTGTWETVGSVMEPAAGLGAGWVNDPQRGMLYRQMSGRTVEGVTGSVFEVLAGGAVSYGAVSLIPRGWVNGTHVTLPALVGATNPDYYIIGGVTEQGPDTVVEHYQP